MHKQVGREFTIGSVLIMIYSDVTTTIMKKALQPTGSTPMTTWTFYLQQAGHGQIVTLEAL